MLPPPQKKEGLRYTTAHQRYSTLMLTNFSIFKTLFIIILWYSLELFQQCSCLSLQLLKINVLSWISSILEREKNRREPNAVNMEAKT